MFVCALLLAGATSAFARVLTWDSDGDNKNGATDGSGIWNQHQNNKVWFTGTAVQKWSNADLDDAVFGAGGVAGIVTLGDNIVARSLTFNATASGTYTIAGPFTLTLSEGSSSISHPGNITNNQSAAISAEITGINRLTKWGAATLTLSGANTYSGNTFINQGALRVNNTTGSGTGSGNVIVNAGGTLIGGGFISGGVTVNRDATISGGNSVGTLTTGSQIWAPGGFTLFEINDALAGAGTGWDLLNINGGLTINATAADQYFIQVNSLTLGDTAGNVHNFDANQSYSWTLATTTDGISFLGGESESTVFSLLLGQFYNEINGGTFSIATANSDHDLVLLFTPVPEPSSLALLGLGLAGMMWRLRQRPARK